MNNVEFHLSEAELINNLYVSKLRLQTVGPRYEDPIRILHEILVFVPKSDIHSVVEITWKALDKINQSYMSTTRGLKPMSFMDRFNIYAKAKTNLHFTGHI